MFCSGSQLVTHSALSAETDEWNIVQRLDKAMMGGPLVFRTLKRVEGLVNSFLLGTTNSLHAHVVLGQNSRPVCGNIFLFGERYWCGCPFP